VPRSSLPRKSGRPRSEIDIDQVTKLAELGCTKKEIAAYFGMHEATLRARMKENPGLEEAVEYGREMGKVSLRRLQMRHAKGEGGPAVNMTIHLSKHLLGQSDRPIEHNSTEINVHINADAGDRIAAKIDALARRMLPPPELEIIDVVPECVSGGVAEHTAAGGAEEVSGESNPGGGGGA
jgi:hypothetical protein